MGNHHTDRASQSLGLGLHFTRDLRSWAQSGAIKSDPCTLNAPDLAALSEKSRDKSRTHLRMALVGHLDTVFPPGSFEGYRRDGALFITATEGK